MSVFATAESDLALRIRRALSGSTGRMGTRSRVLAAVALCGVFAVTLPSSGIADEDGGDRDEEVVHMVCGVDWNAVKTTPLEEWSDEIKDQIAASDCDLEAISERVRHYQHREVFEAAMATPPDEWTDELKANIVRAGWDLDEFTEGVRQRQVAATSAREGEQQTDLDARGRRIRAAIERGDLTVEEGRRLMAEAREKAGHDGDGEDRLREFQREVVEAAMATPPENWTDELKARIARAGWDVDELAEGIRRRQEHNAEDGASRIEAESETDTDTAVEEDSWGRVKVEAADSE